MMADKKDISPSFDIRTLIDGWEDFDESSSGNEIVDSMRVIANERIGSTKFQHLSDIFGDKHRDFLPELKKLSLIKIDSQEVEKKNVEEIDPIAAKEVLGKIRISEDGIQYWIKPDVLNQGVILCDLQSAIHDNQQLIGRVLEASTSNRDTILGDIILSQGRSGSFLYIPENIQLDGPFVIEIDASSLPKSLFLCHLITLIGSSAKANLIIDIHSNDERDNKSILAIQNDIILDDDSRLTCIQNQKMGDQSALFISERIVEGKNSIVNDFILDKGSYLLDRFITVDGVGEGSEAYITALYQETTNQRYFFDTHQMQLASHTVSDLLFKGVLRKNSYSHWNGNILVAKDTIGSNGYQANNILLMDELAKAESIPGLEILTDDVKCSHGVTMGNIDKNQMFYLQSRGINKEDAENLIVGGFLLSAIKRINDQDLENYIQKTLID